MQRFLVEQVELDRCPFCGGMWFDRGELESVSGRALTLERLAGDTTRRCAYCGITLQTALLESTPAEVCGSCLGTYLDDGELEALAQRKVSLPRGDAPELSRREAVQFQCAGCGKVLALNEGVTTPRGVSCGSCYGMLEFGAGSPRTHNNALSLRDDAPWLVAEALWAFLD